MTTALDGDSGCLDREESGRSSPLELAVERELDFPVLLVFSASVFFSSAFLSKKSCARSESVDEDEEDDLRFTSESFFSGLLTSFGVLKLESVENFLAT